MSVILLFVCQYGVFSSSNFNNVQMIFVNVFAHYMYVCLVCHTYMSVILWSVCEHGVLTLPVSLVQGVGGIVGSVCDQMVNSCRKDAV